MAAWPWEFWNLWSIQILVLFSLGCQITLFLLAGIRMHGGHPMLRLLLWLAYQLADYTATYALGHLSLTGGGGPREHPIVAFWAAFLLLHLGGPDNITGYSLEDNDLWKRHMVNAILQVFGVVYILYEYIADRGALLRLASILMLAIGAVKYWEKAWAVMRSNLVRIRASIKEQSRAMMPVNHGHFHPHDIVLKDGEFDEESLVRRAHSLFYICKRAIVDYPVMGDDSHGQDSTKMIGEVGLWRLMETELSLMYDMLYTKAPVIHTWSGYLVRLISPLAIAVSLLLFMFIDKDAHRRVDVGITYILYACALFMEMVSLLNALGSSWTFAFLSTTRWHWLRYKSLCNKRWDRLRRVVAYLHHPVRAGGGSRYRSRRWSYTMGQYNMLHYCTRSDSAHTRPLLGSLAKMVGWGLIELWTREHYSWVIVLPNNVRLCIPQHFVKLYNMGGMNSQDILRNRWGEEPLIRRQLFRGIFKDSLSLEFQECIILWHIASDVFLAKSQRAKEEEAWVNVKSIKAISNHMIFLLVEQPDMMPGRSHNRLYQLICEYLEQLTHSRGQNMKLCATLKNLFRLHDDPTSNSRVTEREELAKIIYDQFESSSPTFDAYRLPYVAQLAKQLLRMEEDGTINPVQLLLEVWTDILVYGASNCNRKIHAEKLNSGPDLKTIMWLMEEHFHQFYQGSLIKRQRNGLGDDNHNV